MSLRLNRKVITDAGSLFMCSLTGGWFVTTQSVPTAVRGDRSPAVPLLVGVLQLSRFRTRNRVLVSVAMSVTLDENHR